MRDLGSWIADGVLTVAEVQPGDKTLRDIGIALEAHAIIIKCWDAKRITQQDALPSVAEYERKMDALLCRLTNGKFSKTREYSLDFMESMVNEEYEALYAADAAMECETCHDEGTFHSWGYFTCSNCHVVVPVDAVREAPSIGKVVPISYCPNCRAKVVDE